MKTDVAIENDVRSLVEKTVDTYGRLDYAVNNAGIGERCLTRTLCNDIMELCSSLDKLVYNCESEISR